MHAHIVIRDLVCYAYHGVLSQERELGQNFLVSLELEVELPARGRDNLENTVDYRRAADTVRQVMDGEKRLLLETLADEIAVKLLALPRVKSVQVEVSKPHPPMPGIEGGVAVIINRSRGD